MTRVILHGCNGKMGQCITAICKDDPEITIVAGIDVYNGVKNDYSNVETVNVKYKGTIGKAHFSYQLDE